MSKVKYETNTFKWKFDTWWKGTFSFWEAFFSGHISIGPITIFGANAMDWVCNISTKKYGCICFTLPVLARWKKLRNSDKKAFKWHLYCSPNGTPWAATYYIGNDKGEDLKVNSVLRKKLLGHNWDTNDTIKSETNQVINDYSDWTWVFEHYSPEAVKEKWKSFYKTI